MGSCQSGKQRSCPGCLSWTTTRTIRPSKVSHSDKAGKPSVRIGRSAATRPMMHMSTPEVLLMVALSPANSASAYKRGPKSPRLSPHHDTNRTRRVVSMEHHPKQAAAMGGVQVRDVACKEAHAPQEIKPGHPCRTQDFHQGFRSVTIRRSHLIIYLSFVSMNLRTSGTRGSTSLFWVGRGGRYPKPGNSYQLLVNFNATAEEV